MRYLFKTRSPPTGDPPFKCVIARRAIAQLLQPFCLDRSQSPDFRQPRTEALQAEEE